MDDALNPLAGIVPLLGGGDTGDDGYYATVVSIEPLRIQLDATDSIADVTPIALVSNLAPGNRVYAIRKGRQLVVVGRIQPALKQITTGMDLNDLTSSGEYYVIGNYTAQTGSNYPLPYAGRLSVVSIADGVAEQTYRTWVTTSGMSRKFLRDLYFGDWRPWVEETLWSPYVALPLLNGANPYTTFGVPTVRMGGGRVELDGMINLGSGGSAPGTPFAQVTSEYRPATNRLLDRRGGSAYSGPDLRINTSGQIYTNNAHTGYVNLNGTSYRIGD